MCAVALLALAARGGEKLVTLVLGFGVPVLAVLALRALSVPLESVPVRWPRHHQVHNLQLASFTSSSGMNTSNLIFIGHMQKLASSFMYSANRSITDDGVLISSPYGKRLRVRIKSMTTNDDLVLNSASGDDDEEAKNNPVHITLRLLFLDDDEVPDR